MAPSFKTKIRQWNSRALCCSFCRKSKDEVAKLIARPGVYICNECVDLCDAILADDAPSRDR